MNQFQEYETPCTCSFSQLMSLNRSPFAAGGGQFSAGHFAVALALRPVSRESCFHILTPPCGAWPSQCRGSGSGDWGSRCRGTWVSWVALVLYKLVLRHSYFQQNFTSTYQSCLVLDQHGKKFDNQLPCNIWHLAQKDAKALPTFSYNKDL